MRSPPYPQPRDDWALATGSFEPPTNRTFLDRQRARLLEQVSSYQQQVESFQSEAALLVLDRQPGDVQFDEESSEGTTVKVDTDLSLRLSLQASIAEDEAVAALARIDGGSYGTCDRCHAAIGRARLRALPAARHCIACKTSRPF